MTDSQQLKKIFATTLVLFLIGFLIFASLPYLNAFIGAFILFYLFKPFYMWLHDKKKLSKSFSAILVIITIILVVLVPLSAIANILVLELSTRNLTSGNFLQHLSVINSYFPDLDFDVTSLASQFISTFGSFSRNLILSAITNVTKLFVDLTILFFTLYYLLIYSDKLFAKIREYLPFKKENSDLIVEEFENITHATIITTGLIALFQGIFLGVGFWVFGLNNPIIWGFVGVLISFLPLIGIPLIWIPAGLILLFIEGRIGAGIGMMVWGSFLSTIDNFIRPYLQKKFGRVHPLITVIGFFIGLPIFGILGLVIGPLLLSYAILLTRMYIDEYITPASKTSLKNKTTSVYIKNEKN